MIDQAQVTALIITYAPQREVLAACIDSLRNQNPSPKIVIADNLAESDPLHKAALTFESDDCTVLIFNHNHGFGGAINRALRHIDTQYVLISNFDIVYDPDYMEAALSRLESSGDDVIGIAGKTLFYPPNADGNWPGRGPGDPPLENCRGTGGVIDNTGTLVNGLMLAYNRGVGQIDIGQFDAPDRPMGACFAAFLVKSRAFCSMSGQGAGIGLLDAGYFMYYEDIDWCYRANILGYKILYEPKAVAWHHHSLTTRDKPVTFKYHLIQRNLYRTIMSNMRFRTVIRLWLLHARLHIRRARVEKKFGTVTARILLETLGWGIIGLFKRIPIQLRRVVTDTEIVDLAIGEEGHLDDITLRPSADWSNPLASLRRLQEHFPDDPACDLIPHMEKLESGDPESPNADDILDLTAQKCPPLVQLITEITVNLNKKG